MEKNKLCEKLFQVITTHGHVLGVHILSFIVVNWSITYELFWLSFVIRFISTLVSTYVNYLFVVA